MGPAQWAASGRSCLTGLVAAFVTLFVATVVGIATNVWGFLAVIALAALAAYVARADQRRERRERAALEERMGDTSLVTGRWASSLRRAWAARDAMRACVEGLEEGPRRDRLTETLREMDECLVEAGRTARAGSVMEARAGRLSPKRVERQARRAERAGARPEDLDSLARQAEDGRRYARSVDRVRWSLEVHVNEMEAIAADTAMVGLEPEALGRLTERSRRTREGLTALSLAAADLEAPPAAAPPPSTEPTAASEEAPGTEAPPAAEPPPPVAEPDPRPDEGPERRRGQAPG